jgi:hypothetical protein
MCNLTLEQRQNIREMTKHSIDRILTFCVGYNAVQYQFQKGVVNFRDIMDEMHNDYPIKGCGITATLDNLENSDGDDGGYFHENESLAPEDTIDEYNSFPLESSACAYVFTILEMYGDEISDIIRPNARNARESWHRRIYFVENINQERLQVQIASYANAFSIPPECVPPHIIHSLSKIKEKRNAIAHRGYADVKFTEFIEISLKIISHIHLSVLDSQMISYYPYEDFEDKFHESF